MYNKLPWKNIDNMFKVAPIAGYRCVAIEPRTNLTTGELQEQLDRLVKSNLLGYRLYMFDRPELDKSKCSFYKRFGDKVLYAIDV